MSGASDIRVGVLGTGLMGSAMAHRLLEPGTSRSIAWDRRPRARRSRSQSVAPRLPAWSGEVVSGADVVITMLPTAEIVLDVVEPLLEEWPDGDDLAADEQRRGGRGRPARRGRHARTT